MEQLTNPNTGRLFIVFSALLWSLSGAFTKILGLPGPVMAASRVIFAGICLLPLLRRDAIRFRPAMIGMVFCFALMNVTFVTAMTVTTAANAIFLQYTAPLWMMLASVLWLHEPLDKKSLVTAAIGMIGIVVIILGGRSEDLLGSALALTAGIAYAGVAVFLRVLRKENAIWLTTLNHLGSGLLLLPFVNCMAPKNAFSAITPGQWAGLAAFGVIQMAIPYVLFSRALSIVSAQEAGVIALLEPVFNPLITFLAVGERPAFMTLVGGGIILAGVWWRYQRRWMTN